MFPEHSALKDLTTPAMTKNLDFTTQTKITTQTKTKWKNKELSLVSRSNQDGISKLNNAP